jgi:outer membrane immunogenic protein
VGLSARFQGDMQMKWLLTSIVAVAALAVGPASAADMPLKAPPPAPMYNWSGFYFGGTGGVGVLRTEWDYFNAGVIPSPNPTDDATWVGGGFVGIQWQTGNWVFGAEANWIATGLETTASCPNPAFNCVVRLNDYWTAGARVGYVMWNALWYTTGGYAEGRLKTSTPLVATGVNFDTSSATHPGWFIGAGVEFVLGSTGLIFGLEYDHVEFETKAHNPTPFATSQVRNINADIDTFRARLSYKFNWWR